MPDGDDADAAEMSLNAGYVTPPSEGGRLWESGRESRSSSFGNLSTVSNDDPQEQVVVDEYEYVVDESSNRDTHVLNDETLEDYDNYDEGDAGDDEGDIEVYDARQAQMDMGEYVDSEDVRAVLADDAPDYVDEEVLQNTEEFLNENDVDDVDYPFGGREESPNDYEDGSYDSYEEYADPNEADDVHANEPEGTPPLETEGTPPFETEGTPPL